MTRVDFYLVADEAADARPTTVCRLADKAFRLGKRVYIHTADTAEAKHLDRLLWTFSAGSFVPHALCAEALDPPPPVLIGPEPPPTACNDVLIALTPQAPEFYARFTRVADVVGAGETDKQQGRERFRFYRERGAPPQTHHLPT